MPYVNPPLAGVLSPLTYHHPSKHSSTIRVSATRETSAQKVPVVEERKKPSDAKNKDKDKDKDKDVGYQIEKPALRDIPTTYDGVAEAEGELNLFDPRTSLFMTQADNVRCQLLRTADFTCKLLSLAVVVKCFETRSCRS